MIRICLVDDDALLRDALSLSLRDQNCEVSALGGAIGALDAISRDRFDVIVTDLKMPGMGGAELISAIRVRSPETPIVAMSGEGDNAATCGAELFLRKPFKIKQLIAAIEAARLMRRP